MSLPPCPSCGCPDMRAYCPDCGEKRARPGEVQLGHMIGQFFGASLSPNNRLWKSLGRIALRPGQLATDACAGKRVAYMKPMQLFLICNILYFLLQPLTFANTLNNSLNSHLNEQVYSTWAQSITVDYLPENEAERRLFSERFSAFSDRLSRSLVIILIPFFAALFACALFPTRRRLAEHWLLAVEFTAFMLFYTLIVALGAGAHLGALYYGYMGWPHQEVVISLTLLIMMTAWTILAMKRFYKIRLRAALWRAPLTVAFMIIPIWLFRASIFFWSLQATIR